MAQSGISYDGSDLKILVELTASGFDMFRDDWSVGIKCGNKIVKTIPKSEAIQHEDGWFVTVRADDLRPGKIEVVGYAQIPDEDFDDGIRNEVDKDDLLTYSKV